MNTFTIIQMVLAVLIVVTVILQSRGSNNGMAFGGGNETYRAKKGIEKMLFYATIVLASLFAAISIIALISN